MSPCTPCGCKWPESGAVETLPQSYNDVMTLEVEKLQTGAPFTRCVRCGYSLRGLPAEYACPECGLRYDERCALYRVPMPPRWIVLLVPFVAWMLWGGIDYFSCFPFRLPSSPLHLVSALMFLIPLLCVAYVIWIIMRLRRGDLKIAVTTDGLLVNLPHKRNELIPWTNITRASANVGSLTVHLKRERRVVTFGGDYKMFRTPAEAERCAGQINERISNARTEVTTDQH